MKSRSITPNVDEFFRKLASAGKTEAQVRYPELLKVSQTPTPNLAPKKTNLFHGKIPTRSSANGGS